MFDLNIQLFAEGGDEGGETPTTPTFTNEQLDTYLDSDDGKKYLQPKLDKYFAKGLDTWKDNNLDKLYEERYAKENPAETKEMKMIRELQAKIEKQEREATTSKMKDLAISELSEKGLSVEFATWLLGSTEQETKLNVMEFDNQFNKALQQAIEGKIQPTKGKAMPSEEKKQNDPFMSAFTQYDKFYE